MQVVESLHESDERAMALGKSRTVTHRKPNLWGYGAVSNTVVVVVV